MGTLAVSASFLVLKLSASWRERGDGHPVLHRESKRAVGGRTGDPIAPWRVLHDPPDAGIPGRFRGISTRERARVPRETAIAKPGRPPFPPRPRARVLTSRQKSRFDPPRAPQGQTRKSTPPRTRQEAGSVPATASTATCPAPGTRLPGQAGHHPPRPPPPINLRPTGRAGQPFANPQNSANPKARPTTTAAAATTRKEKKKKKKKSFEVEVEERFRSKP
ncbi:hypothetical protein NL676_020588 [Syzygium grande]|nr:hypothetical protein NL676_020588 [Syzygium grande]